MTEDSLMTPAQVAKYLGVTAQYLADRRFKHQAPPFVKIGAAVRYKESDLIAFIDANTHHPAKGSK